MACVRIPQCSIDITTVLRDARLGDLRLLAEDSTARTFGGRSLPCETPDGLMLLKLFALPSLYRQGDVARVALYENDLRMLLDVFALDTDQLLAVLAPHVLPSDIEQLRQILKDVASRPRAFE